MIHVPIPKLRDIAYPLMNIIATTQKPLSELYKWFNLSERQLQGLCDDFVKWSGVDAETFGLMCNATWDTERPVFSYAPLRVAKYTTGNVVLYTLFDSHGMAAVYTDARRTDPWATGFTATKGNMNDYKNIGDPDFVNKPILQYQYYCRVLGVTYS